jgi:polar amino acid transport system permease protein
MLLVSVGYLAVALPVIYAARRAQHSPPTPGVKRVATGGAR